MVTFEAFREGKEKIAVVGLGYVGLPLAVNLAAHFKVVGYDVKPKRIDELKNGYDRTLEVTRAELQKAAVHYTSDPARLGGCKLVIVAVPTPIDEYHIPDLTPLRRASEIVGRHMAPGTCVVYESTVYPGATEEVCIPILENESGLTFGADFTVGYSPERINPGDKVHTLANITKVVSGSDADTLALLLRVYGQVVSAGVHPASSLKVAEAAKVIENTQRDLNIALMNELAMIFHRLGIDTQEVLEAAGTKWNFLPFKPGLVGGHCIGVDPYYLTFKAESIGYHPEMILAGRRINDNMGKYVAERAVKMLIKAGKYVSGARVGLLGITFKEDVPDLRNTKITDILHELEDYGVEVLVHDPVADPDEAREYYGVELSPLERLEGADAIILAVRHRQYCEMGLGALGRLCTNGHPIFLDIKAAFDKGEAEAMNMDYWRL